MPAADTHAKINTCMCAWGPASLWELNTGMLGVCALGTVCAAAQTAPTVMLDASVCTCACVIVCMHVACGHASEIANACEDEGKHVCACVRACVHERKQMCVCVRACVRARAHMCLYAACVCTQGPQMPMGPRTATCGPDQRAPALRQCA